MNILGISALDKESTATIVRDGTIVAAVSEERLSRVKQQAGFPTRAVESVLALSGLTPPQVDRVAYPFFEVWHELRLAGAGALWDASHFATKLRRRGLEHSFRHYGALAKSLAIGFRRKLSESDRELAGGLRSLGLTDKLRRYDHQLSHAVRVGRFEEFQLTTWRALKSAVGGGLLSVGSHTRTHGDLSTMTLAEQIADLRASREQIERELSMPCTAVAYPYGRWNPDTVIAASDASYRCGLTVRNGFNTSSDQPWRLKRIMVGDKGNFPILCARLSGSWDRLRIHQ